MDIELNNRYVGERRNDVGGHVPVPIPRHPAAGRSFLADDLEADFERRKISGKRREANIWPVNILAGKTAGAEAGGEPGLSATSRTKQDKKLSDAMIGAAVLMGLAVVVKSFM